MALAPVKVMASTPALLPQGGEPFIIPSAKVISGQKSFILTAVIYLLYTVSSVKQYD
jgi:hypothetical protein